MHSLPKETVKKLHGIFTTTVDFLDAPSSLQPGKMSFTKGAKLQAPLGGANQVVDDFFWRKRVMAEQQTIVRGMQQEQEKQKLVAASAGGASARDCITSGSATNRSRTSSVQPSRSCPSIPALMTNTSNGLQPSASSGALHRQAQFDKMRKSVKSRQGAEFIDTLKNLDQKLQQAKAKARESGDKDPAAHAKAKKAVKSLQKLVQQIKTVEKKNLKYTDTLK
jgi:hypothetical protein